jgi:hypothetical protein
LQDLVIQRLQEALAEQLQGFRQARAAEAKRQLVAAAAEQLRLHAGSAEAASAALQQLGHLQLGPQSSAGTADSVATAAAAAVVVKGPPAATLLGQTVYLLRSDVPAILQAMGAGNAQPVEGSSSILQHPAAAATAVAPGAVTPAVLQALVLGSWCSQGPQALRRSGLVLRLIEHFGQVSEQLLAAIRSLEVCSRTAGFNSRGHSASLVYPGPQGWTPEYAAARAAAVASGVAQQVRQGKRNKVVRYMRQMQRYTAVAAWAQAAAASAAASGGGGGCSKVSEVAGVLAGELDANRLACVVARLEAVLGMNLPAAVAQVA